MHGRDLRGARPYLQSATAAVEADARPSAILRHVMRIHIAHTIAIYMRNHGVVVEMRAVPVTALISNAEVAKPVVDPAIEADVPRPVAVMEPVHAANVRPVSRRPQGANIRRLHPAARDPVVAIGPPGPIAGCPDVVRIGRR